MKADVHRSELGMNLRSISMPTTNNVQIEMCKEKPKIFSIIMQVIVMVHITFTIQEIKQFLGVLQNLSGFCMALDLLARSINQ